MCFYSYTEEDQFLQMAAYLDPRFKSMPYLNSMERDSLTSFVKQHLIRIKLTESAAEGTNVEQGNEIYYN